MVVQNTQDISLAPKTGRLPMTFGPTNTNAEPGITQAEPANHSRDEFSELQAKHPLFDGALHKSGMCEPFDNDQIFQTPHIRTYDNIVNWMQANPEGGIIYDPSSGKMVFYKNEEDKKQIEAGIADWKKNNLLLASAGDPASVKKIVEDIAQRYSISSPNFYNGNAGLISDAVKVKASAMSTAELILFTSQFPELGSILNERLASVEKAGLNPNEAFNKNGTEISQIIEDNKKIKEAPPALEKGIVANELAINSKSPTGKHGQLLRSELGKELKLES